MSKIIILYLFIFINLLFPNYKCNSKKLKSPKEIIQTFENQELSTKEIDWYIVPNKNHITPEPNKIAIPIFEKFSGYYVGNTDKKVLYLTFDEGYENGYTSKILDVLKKQNVPAAFFVVRPYIKTNPELIQRMVSEGHTVCNHSSNHPSMAKISNIEIFEKELTDVEIEYKKITNADMPKYFRPPMGKFSEYSMNLTNKLGYKSIFWSLAYKDFDVKNQPTKEKAKSKILERIHNGSIILLHAVSKTNSEILDEIIQELKSQGYEFRPITDF